VSVDVARAAADRFENTYRNEFPAAVACLAEDRDALLAIHRVPVRHRIRVRTTNLAERSFEEERRRTKVIPRLMSERAAMKLVFAARFGGRITQIVVRLAPHGAATASRWGSDTVMVWHADAGCPRQTRTR
jgi:Transposase, Mutator family